MVLNTFTILSDHHHLSFLELFQFYKIKEFWACGNLICSRLTSNCKEFFYLPWKGSFSPLFVSCCFFSSCFHSCVFVQLSAWVILCQRSARCWCKGLENLCTLFFLLFLWHRMTHADSCTDTQLWKQLEKKQHETNKEKNLPFYGTSLEFGWASIW